MGPLPETTSVVNPLWRTQDQAVRRERSLLLREQAQFGGLSAPESGDSQAMADFEKQKGQRLEQIRRREQHIEQLKAERKAATKHVLLKDLPEDQRFSQLRTAKKHFVDTIKLIAYRAETALVQIAREKLSRSDDARALVRQGFQSAVDLEPDLDRKTLTVRLHRLSSAAHDHVLEHLSTELSASETTSP